MNGETFKNMPYSDVFKHDFERGHIVYYGAASTEIQSQLRTAVESVMLQGMDPEAAYYNLKARVQEIIDEN